MTLDEVINIAGNELTEAVRDLAGRVSKRGDGIAVYRNEHMGHPDFGLTQFVSYGSPAAQIEAAEPPTTLPDIGGHINWRYQLIGTWKEEAA